MKLSKWNTLLLLSATIILNISACNHVKPTDKLMVGTGVADITPPFGYPRYGYPPVISTGVKDPLNAKALVMRQGDITGAIVVCDLLGIPRDLSRIVRERASEKTGIPFQNITISATHTHTSPLITEDFQAFADREFSDNLTDQDKESYFSYLIEGITSAIINAAGNLREANIISGIGIAEGISFNRRQLMTDGRVRFNPGRLNQRIVRPAGPVDPRVHFILFNDPYSDKVTSSFSVFASHYVRDGTMFSADYPFYLQKHLNNIFGNQLVSVFAPGPSGDINTVDLFRSYPVEEDGMEKVEFVGLKLAEAVNKARPGLVHSTPDLKILTKVEYLPLQDYSEEELTWSKEGGTPLYEERDFLQRRRKLKISVWGVQPPLEQLRNREAIPPSWSGEPWRLPVEIHAFRIDHETAIVTMPGELFTRFGIDLKERSPFSNTMLIGLANADIAYVPTKEAFREGDYEPLNSRLMPGSGEKMVEIALEMLNDLK